MDIGIQEITDVIASSTTAYLLAYSPLFLFIGGLVLALAVVFILPNFIPNRTPGSGVTFDDAKADELEEFFSRKGRSGAPYDFKDIDRMV